MNQLEDIFAYEDGYYINKVLATSFTFSTLMLGELLLRIAAYNNNAITKGTVVQKKLALKREVESEQKEQKLMIFVHDFEGKDKVYDELINGRNIYLKRYLDANLNKFVKKVQVKGGYFHPKIILVELKSCNDDSFKYRLLVSSKNLVKDDYFQLGMYFEGSSNCECVGFDSKSLMGFISELSEQQENDKKWLSELKNGLENVQFSVHGENSEGIEKVELLFGIPKPKKGNGLREKLEEDFEDSDRWDIITDSLNYKFLGSKSGERKIVDNPIRWLEQIEEQDYVKAIGKIKEYCIPYVPVDDTPYLHAKVLAASKNDIQTVWVGSANFTESAFENNYECCVRYLRKLRNGNDFQINNLESNVFPKKKLLSADDLKKQNKNRIFEEFVKLLDEHMKLDSEINPDEHTVLISLSIDRNDKIFKDINKYSYNDFWIQKEVKIELPYNYGSVVYDLGELLSSEQPKQYVELKYKQGSISEKNNRVIITFTLIAKGSGNHLPQICSVWKSLEINDEYMNKLNDENNGLIENTLTGNDLLRDNTPDLYDVIPPHYRGANTDNAELLLASYLGNISGNKYNNLTVIENNINSIIEMMDVPDDEFLEEDSYNTLSDVEKKRISERFAKMKEIIMEIKRGYVDE